MPFTQEQQNAINATNRELLVSAAAGSGKTAVLVERIVHMIADLNYQIDEMLIVTYTRAAAAELRDRLETRMMQAARENPRLIKQAELVGSAQISTIHAYCQRMVRENFRDCEIDPQFTLGDERTLNRLYRDSMEEVLEELYNKKNEDECIGALLKKLNEKGLEEALDALYHFLMSQAEPNEWMNTQCKKAWSIETIDQEPISLAFMEEASLMLEGALAQWAENQRLSKSPCFPEPLQKTLQADLAALSLLSEENKKGLTAFHQGLMQCKFITLARTKPSTSDEIACVEKFKALREQYKNSIKKIKELLPGNLEGAIKDMNHMSPAINGLCHGTALLMEAYQRRKLEAATLDFNDLEHMTLKLLKNPEIQKRESAKFAAVFVDEYQDVSAIQEAILNRLKRQQEGEKNQSFFYVGDVKQSIYRFRLAEPRLFLNKLETFSTQEDAPQRKIILNKNFRSREGVLRSVNRTFIHVMDRRATEIDYDRSAMLYTGLPSKGDPITELHLCQGERAKDLPLLEARLIAQDIKRTVGQPVPTLDGEPGGLLHYRDIAILLPVVKNIADKVEMVLTQAGIPVYTDNAKNALSGEETIQAAQHLLLLDNEQNDTALISELRSPLFQFTEQELSAIRLAKPEVSASFLEALRHTAKQETSELSNKCQQALSLLEEERFLYRSMPPEEYLWDFLMRSGLYAHFGAQPGGKLRQANLRMLCQKAGEYASLHREGLGGFLESLAETSIGDSSSPTVVNPWEDVVRIMTIHKSKGLEFPTVYLMGLGGSLARRKQTKILSMHGELGLGLMYMNEKARTKRTTLLQNGIELRKSAEERAEKARVLYVAMTRPKNRLVMIGSQGKKKNGLETLVETAIEKPKEIKDLAGVRTATSYLEWLIQTLDKEDEFVPEEEENAKEKGEDADEKKGVLHEKPTSFPHKNGFWRVFFHNEIDNSRDSQFVQKVNEDFLPNLMDSLEKAKQIKEKKEPEKEEKEPLPQLPSYTHQPLKLGVTALCRAMEEQEKIDAGTEADQEETPEIKRTPLLVKRPRLLEALQREPAFLTPLEENKGAMKGVLTHKLLGLIRLEGLAQKKEEKEIGDYIKEEIHRLKKIGVFKPGEEKEINILQVAQFFCSQLGQRMLRAKRVYREWSFNLKIQLPLETILQGVIDLCFLENDKWVLVDFKTDRVNTTQELWSRYERQVNFYILALEKATPYPVGEAGLYSLKLNTADIRKR